MIADLPSLQSIQLGEYALRGDTSQLKEEKNTVVMRSFLLCNGIMVQISLR